MFAIYEVTNLVNKKSYVGFTNQNPYTKRWMQHKAQAKCGSKFHIHCAIRKYGPENFTWKIIEEGWCPKIGKDIREPYWISVLKPEYNHTDGGEGQLGSKHALGNKYALGARYTRSELDRSAISHRMKGNKNGKGCLGLKHSDKTKKLWSEQRKGRSPWNKGIRMSEYNKENM